MREHLVSERRALAWSLVKWCCCLKPVLLMRSQVCEPSASGSLIALRVHIIGVTVTEGTFTASLFASLSRCLVASLLYIFSSRRAPRFLKHLTSRVQHTHTHCLSEDAKRGVKFIAAAPSNKLGRAVKALGNSEGVQVSQSAVVLRLTFRLLSAIAQKAAGQTWPRGVFATGFSIPGREYEGNRTTARSVRFDYIDSGHQTGSILEGSSVPTLQ